MDALKDVVTTIQNKNNFLILGHIDPDGDSMGSIFALKWILDKINKKSMVIVNESPLERYEFFFDNRKQESQLWNDYEKIEEYRNKKLSPDSFNYIILDCSNLDRLGEGKELVDDNFIINIDHHPDNAEFGDINYVDSSRAAVGEIIYELAELLQVSLNRKIGEAIATAIITDTGSLQYENTSSRVLSILSQLMKKDIDLYKINRKLFGNYSFNTVKLKGMALTTLERTNSGEIAWLYVTKKMMDKTDTDIKATTGFVNYARDIAGVEVGLGFFESENRIDVSLRSNSYVKVNKIASKFGGGGHVKAAGCSLEMELEKAINKVINEVKKFV